MIRTALCLLIVPNILGRTHDLHLCGHWWREMFMLTLLCVDDAADVGLVSHHCSRILSGLSIHMVATNDRGCAYVVHRVGL